MSSFYHDKHFFLPTTREKKIEPMEIANPRTKNTKIGTYSVIIILFSNYIIIIKVFHS